MEQWILTIHMFKMGRKTHQHFTGNKIVDCTRYLNTYKPPRGYEIYYASIEKDIVLL